MKKNSPADINKLSSKTTESAAIDQSEAEEVARKSINCTPGSPYSLREITIIDNMESFLKANGATAVDPKVIKTVAETWTKRFNTSPGTLQDVTMDQSYGVGYRSPCVSLQQFQGATSPPPTQGRSVREFEEQMATLRKENFNLKLRLYFIEESIPGYQQALQSSGGHETIMKQLVDCKVEMEMLRKEIQDKQEILKDAAHAMNQMEKIQKDTETKCQAIIDELKQKIQYLEMERDMDKSHHGEFMNDLLGRSDISENLNALQKIRELEGIVKQSDDKIKEYESHIGKIDKIVVKRDETIREYEEKVKELVFQNAELVEAVEIREKELVNAETRRLRQELQEHKTELADKICMLQDAEEKLNSRTQIHEQACRTIQKLMLNIANQKLEIIRLKKNSGGSESNANSSGPNKENMHSSSNVNDSTGLCRSMSDSEALNELSLTQKQKLERTIEQQELTIKNLKAEVKKKTANLQNLVNKELWEKNREIERLTKLINRDSANGTSTVSPTALNTSTNNDGCCNELQQSFTDADYSKAVDRNKLLQRKVEVLIKRLANVHSHDALITRLRKEAHEAQAEAYSAEKWRRECAEVCGMLSTRLEELAGFLNSLLKHKDILGFLAVDRRRAMRNAIDRSLDLSKSLNQTLSISGISMTEHSFGHLSCNLSTLDVDVDNTFNSHEDTQEQFDSLKAENRALKKELDKRRSVELKKDRRSLPQGVPSILVAVADNQSESDAWSEPDRIVSLARIGLEDRSASLTTKDTKSQSHQQLQNSGAAGATTDSESDELNDSRTSKTRTQDRVTHLEQLLAQRDDRILHIQCQLVEADNRLKKENLRVIDLNHEINDLRQRNEELNADIMAIGLVEQHDDSTLQRQIDEKTRSLEKIQEERERIAMEARLAEMQIGELKSDIEDLKLKQEVDLTLAAEKEKRKLEELQRDMKAQMQQRIVELEYKHEDALARDWVVRAVYDESHKQLATLQQQYVEAQRTIEYLQENEQELKQTLVESELEVRSLKKQLDESTLQASKAVLERTKVCNDKLQLEKRVQQLTQQIAVEEEERNDLRRNVLHLKNTQAVLQGKITALQEQLATNRFNGSDVSQSGYTSEEIPNVMPSSSADATTALNLSQQQQRRTVDAIKHVNSPSPDLGIESDAGRVSSVELSQAQCTLYKTVELSATNTPSNSSTFAADTDMGHTSTRNIKEEENSDSPMEQKANVKEEKLDYQGNVPITASATINTSPATESATTAAATATAPALPIKHDCAKVEAENAELRRKLIRTKQAFEDTYKTLHMANQKKAQVEKNIKNQILKTHSLLKNVRSNLEN